MSAALKSAVSGEELDSHLWATLGDSSVLGSWEKFGNSSESGFFAKWLKKIAHGASQIPVIPSHHKYWVMTTKVMLLRIIVIKF